MNIIVCIKQVPDTTNVRINPETNTLVRAGVESIINPFDMYALEEAIRLKEQHEGTVSVLSMGPPQVEEALREAVSLGVDDAYLLSDRAFAGADTLATAYTLAAGIRKIGAQDIILLGRQAIDGDTGQVGPGVAENLGIPHITDVKKIESIDENGTIVVQRMLEEGYVRLKCKLPIIMTVVKEINDPRLPSLRGIARSKSAAIPVWDAGALGADKDMVGLPGSCTRVIKVFFPRRICQSEMLEGDLGSQVERLVGKLKDASLI